MATISWNSSVEGSWTDPGIWLGDAAPGTSDTALLVMPVPSTGEQVFVNTGTSVAIQTLIMQGTGVGLNVEGTFDVLGAATLTAGALNVFAGAELIGTYDLDGGSLGDEGGGAVTLDSVAIGGTGAVDGSFDIVGNLAALAGTADFNGSSFDFAGSQTLAGHAIDGIATLSTSGTVTIAGGTTLDDTGGTLDLAVDTGGTGTVVNDGTILAEYLPLGLTFTNNGDVTLSGPPASTNDPTFDSTAAFTNAGTLLITGGSWFLPFLTRSTTLFSNSGLIEIGAGSTFEPQYSGSFTGTPTLANTGTISLDAGGMLIPVVSVVGGTLRSSGGIIQGGALDSLTVLGSVTLLDGVAGDALTFDATAPDMPAVLTLAPIAPGDGGTIEGGALTFGANTVITYDTAEQLAFSITGSTLDFAGTIDALANGTLTLQAAALDAAPQPIANSGVIEIASGEMLVVAASSIDNTGTIVLASGATLEFAQATNLATLAAIDNEGGTFLIGGTLDATGQTATLNAASPLADVAYGRGAVLQGGTFVEAGASIALPGTLSATTWRGTLDLSQVASISIANGIAVTDTAGGPGMLSLAGTSSQLVLLDDTTLDNMALAFGGSLSSSGTAGISALEAGAPSLTLGSGITFSATGDLPESGLFLRTGLVVQGDVDITGTGSVATHAQGPLFSLQSNDTDNDGNITVTDDNAQYFSFDNDDPDVNSGDDVGEPGLWQGLNLGSYGLWEALANLPPPRFEGPLALAASNTLTAPELALIQQQENTITGTGTITAGAGVFLAFDSAIATTQTLEFTTADAVMMLAFPTQVAAAIVGFGVDNAIDLPLDGFVGGTPTYTPGSLIVPTAAGNVTLDATLAAGVTASQLALIADPNGGTAITVACFAEGTRLATPRGPVAVERLAVGNHVLTASGTAEKIVWIGRLAPHRHTRPRDVQPVRIRAHSFGPFQPCRDLLLSPDHAVFSDDALIPARCLINGSSITKEDVASVTYWHVELARHDVLLAENLPCESFLDTGNRDAFTGQSALAPHPDFSRAVWDGEACAPLVVAGPALDRVRARLARYPAPSVNSRPNSGRASPIPASRRLCQAIA